MRSNYKIMIILVISLLLTALFLVTANAVHSDDTYTVNINFRSDDNGLTRTITYPTEYSDSFFDTNSYTYSEDISKLSILLAASAASTVMSDENYNKYIDPSNEPKDQRYYDIYNAYNALGLKSAKFINYDDPLSDSSDKVAFAIASKTIALDDDKYTLVIVTIRGGQYGSEWASNFNINLTPESEGFMISANEVVNETIKYTSDISGDVILLITGFSRAAAVANLAAAKLDRLSLSGEVPIKTENIHAYCFATPNYVYTRDNLNYTSNIYKNIYSVIESNDPITHLIFKDWGYSIYGSVKYFNYTDENIRLVRDEYAKISGGQEYIVKNNTANILNIIKETTEIMPSREVYADKIDDIIIPIVSEIFSENAEDLLYAAYSDNESVSNSNYSDMIDEELILQRISEETPDTQEKVLQFLEMIEFIFENSDYHDIEKYMAWIYSVDNSKFK